MSASPITDIAPATRPSIFLRLRRAAGKAIRCVDTWIDRARQRRTLADLTDDQLRDIGLSRAEAHRESSKLFWKP